MVSPYLKRPIRTLEQALKDRIQVRLRSKAAASGLVSGCRHMSPSALTQVHVLLSAQMASATSGRVRPITPTDREAA
jgi:hypothetical protein